MAGGAGVGSGSSACCRIYDLARASVEPRCARWWQEGHRSQNARRFQVVGAVSGGREGGTIKGTQACCCHTHNLANNMPPTNLTRGALLFFTPALAAHARRSALSPRCPALLGDCRARGSICRPSRRWRKRSNRKARLDKPGPGVYSEIVQRRWQFPNNVVWLAGLDIHSIKATMM